MSKVPSVSIKGGKKLPLIGLGTWELVGKSCTYMVEKALEIGYRHIDTAHLYQNHAAIKKAIKNIPRDQIFITSKFALDQIDYKNCEESVEEVCDLALKQLGTDYIDLYLIHRPDRSKPMKDVLHAMNRLAEKGKISYAGVSNFNIHHLQDMMNAGVQISANQVEFHPYLYQKALWDFCKSHQIQLIAYRPLGKGALLAEPLLQEIGAKHKKSSAQIALRWIVQKGIPVIPKASSEKHLKENFAIFDFKLSDDEMNRLDLLNRNQRFCKPEWSDFDY